MQKHLEHKLQITFNPSYLKVVNESSNHAGNRSDSHFKIIVVSDEFNNKPLIKRHRLINELLKQELQQIHALAIHTYTKIEWKNKKKEPESPKCSNVK